MKDLDRRLLALLQDGLPLVQTPYAALGRRLGLDEAVVRARLAHLQAEGVISRFGVVIRHHEAGYRANAMTVFDVPDDDVRDAARRLVSLPYITLCYRRTRRPPTWPYNLFCMIQGRDRGEVEGVAESAHPLGDDELKALTELASRLSGKQVVLTAAHKPELIGGVRLVVGNVLYDGSLRAALDQLQDKLQHSAV